MNSNIILTGGQDNLVRVYEDGSPSIVCIEASNWITALIAREDGVFARYVNE